MDNSGEEKINYIAPELFTRFKYSIKSDLWSLGCIIYELYTLNYCFENKIYNELIEQIKKSIHGKINLNF